MTVDKPSTQPPSRGGVVAALRRFTSGASMSLYRLTNGTVGGKLGGRPILLLTTIGRKSGKERVTPLLYLPEGDHFIVIASNWGEANHPMWWLNLQANPRAKIQIGPKIIPVTARQARRNASVSGRSSPPNTPTMRTTRKASRVKFLSSSLHLAHSRLCCTEGRTTRSRASGLPGTSSPTTSITAANSPSC